MFSKYLGSGGLRLDTLAENKNKQERFQKRTKMRSAPTTGNKQKSDNRLAPRAAMGIHENQYDLIKMVQQKKM